MQAGPSPFANPELIKGLFKGDGYIYLTSAGPAVDLIW